MFFVIFMRIDLFLAILPHNIKKSRFWVDFVKYIKKNIVFLIYNMCLPFLKECA